MAHGRCRLLTTSVLALALLAAPAAAQDDEGGGEGGSGGRGGGGGRIDSDLSLGVPPSQRSRLDILESAFALTGDQRTAVERVLDAAHAGAADVREQLRTRRAAISTAVIEGQDRATIDAAVHAYAEPVAAMTGIEMRALAAVLRALTPEQQGNSAAIRTAFFLMRGLFLDDRRWNTIPAARGY